MIGDDRSEDISFTSFDEIGNANTTVTTTTTAASTTTCTRRCVNGGVCNIVNSTQVCWCLLGFSGSFCELQGTTLLSSSTVSTSPIGVTQVPPAVARLVFVNTALASREPLEQVHTHTASAVRATLESTAVNVSLSIHYGFRLHQSCRFLSLLGYFTCSAVGVFPDTANCAIGRYYYCSQATGGESSKLGVSSVLTILPPLQHLSLRSVLQDSDSIG